MLSKNYSPGLEAMWVIVAFLIPSWVLWAASERPLVLFTSGQLSLHFKLEVIKLKINYYVNMLTRQTPAVDSGTYFSRHKYKSIMPVEF